MTHSSRNYDHTAIWHADGSPNLDRPPGPGSGPGLGEDRTVDMNVTQLPATDQSRIWTFLEFMPEHTTTTWRVRSDAQVQVWFANGKLPFVAPPDAPPPAAVVYVVDHSSQAPADSADILVRPLEMGHFAALLQRLEKRIPPVR